MDPALPQTTMDDMEAKINLLRDEIEWLSNRPVSSLTALFIFLNDPALNEPFIMPPHDEPIRPNSGLYTLQHNCSSNKAFLQTENRYHNMIWSIQLMERENSTIPGLEGIKQTIFDKLSHLNREKAFQWAQQRAHVEPHAISVNTGDVFSLTLSNVWKCSIPSVISTLFLTPRTIRSYHQSRLNFDAYS